MGRAISHDALCDQWEAATVEDVGALAIWLIFVEMPVGNLSHTTGGTNEAAVYGLAHLVAGPTLTVAGVGPGRAQPPDPREDLDPLVLRIELLLKLFEPSAGPVTGDTEAMDPDLPQPELRDKVPDTRVDAVCSLQHYVPVCKELLRVGG